MLSFLKTARFQRPLNNKSSKELINEMESFKDTVRKLRMELWISDINSLIDILFNKNDKRYKELLIHQQDIIDLALAECMQQLTVLLEDGNYKSSKESKVEKFILKTMISRKSRKFNLQLIHLFSYPEFGHRNLVERKRAINILTQKG